jgi:activator of HSP90 ATPase
MARVGEGDQRWIVESRADGKNVGNWHWTEKNYMPWSRDRFTELCKNVSLNNSVVDIKFTEMDQITGDINICQRKGKSRLISDFVIKVKWEGNMKKSDDSVVSGKGVMEVEVDIEGDCKYRVTMDNENSGNAVMKDIMNREGKPVIKSIIDRVLNELKLEKERFQKEIDDLKNQSSSSTTTTETTTPPPQKKIQGFNNQVVTSSSSNTETLSTTTVRQTVEFENVNPDQLFDTLTDQSRLSAITGGPCKYEKNIGGEVVLLDGAVNGVIKELIPGKRLVETWRFKDWPQNHFSELILKFEAVGSGTKIILLQKNVPSSEQTRALEGWERFFWSRIKNIFGWGYKIKGRD